MLACSANSTPVVQESSVSLLVPKNHAIAGVSRMSGRIFSLAIFPRPAAAPTQIWIERSFALLWLALRGRYRE
jgi:hypothetical protein